MRACLNRLIVICLVCACSVATPLPLSADDSGSDDLDGLTEEEKAYVSHLREVNEDVRFALFRQGERFVEGDVVNLGDAVFDPGKAGETLRRWKSELAAYAPEYRASPPASMQDLADTFDAFARTLEGAYDPCLEVLQEEGRLELLQAGSRWLSGLLGADFGADEPRPTVVAKLHVGVAGEQVRLEDRLAAVRAELEAWVGDAQEAQAVGESFLGIWLDDCFITAAALGTQTLHELDVLRSFRDNVLLLSPAGSDLVGFYYAASPPLARFILDHGLVRTVVREGMVDPAVRTAALLRPLWMPS